MADDVTTRHRYRVLTAQVPDQCRAGAVHGIRVPAHPLNGPALVLQASGVHVVVPVSRVPADVVGIQVLRNVTVGRPQRIVPSQVARLLNELDGGVVRLLGVVDDDPRQQRTGGPVGDVMVPVLGQSRTILLIRSGDPLDRKTVGTIDRWRRHLRLCGSDAKPKACRTAREGGKHRHEGEGTAADVTHRSTPTVGQAARKPNLVECSSIRYSFYVAGIDTSTIRRNPCSIPAKWLWCLGPQSLQPPLD